MKGIYALGIFIDQEIVVRVGALGELLLCGGMYVYVGSALNGLGPRVLRHLAKSRGVLGRFHWHIDYLLFREEVSVGAVFVRETLDREECLLADFVGLHGVPVKGFGCSDCRCVSHLFRVEGFDFLRDFGLVEWSDLIS